MKHRLYITRYIFITYVYELKKGNHPGSFFIPPQALAATAGGRTLFHVRCCTAMTDKRYDGFTELYKFRESFSGSIW
jgi:hypothetical protein